MNALLIAVVVLAAPLVQGYDEKYDKIDVDKIIADDALFAAYIDCMLDKGPCEVEHSADFKKILPEIISTNCAQCTPIQKDNVRKTFKALSEKKPDMVAQFKEKYDPKGEYEKEFTAFMIGTN